VNVDLSALSTRALVALATGAVLLWSVLLWFVYVSPQRTDASRAADDLAAAELELTQAQLAGRSPQQKGLRASDLFRLVKAMPESGDQAGLVLELTRLGDAAGLKLRSISSADPAAGPGGTTVIPVTVGVGGTFRDVADFLRRARTLVRVRHGRLRATGRLFSVQSIELVESSTARFPQLDATIVLDAFVYDGPIQIERPSSPGVSGGDESTSPTGAAAGGGTGS
jgi:Tfp pilus assembly protein PilO